MFKLFYHANLRLIREYFKTERAARLITAFLFLLVFALLAVGLFFFFKHGFAYIKNDAYFGPSLSLLAYEFFFLGISALIFASALVSGLFGFFQIEAAPWILSSPRYRILPGYVISKIFASSLWPLVFVAVPGLLAIRSVSHLGWGVLALMIFALAFLAIFAAFSAAILIFLIAKILQIAGRILRKKILSMDRVVLFLVLVLVLISFLFWLQIGRLDLHAIFQPENAQAKSADPVNLAAKFSALPSNFAALALFGFEYDYIPLGLAATLVLLLLSTLVVTLFLLFSSWYLELWQILQEGKADVLEKKHQVVSKPAHFPKYMRGAYGALFEKEALVMFRSGKNTLWLLFMVFLWLIQASTNVLIQKNMARAGLTHPNLPLVLEAFQVIIIVYFLCALVLRFAFPSFGVEKKTAWIIASAPVNLVRVFWSKLLFFAVSFSALSLIFTFLNSAILGVSLPILILFIAIILTSAISITIFGLSLGIFTTNLDTNDPEMLSTSLPGLAFIALSLLYGALGSLFFYQILKSGNFFFFLAFAAISLLAIILFLARAVRELSNFEFTNR